MVPESDVVITHDSVWMLPLLVADIFRSGLLSAPKLLTAVKKTRSYVRSTRGGIKMTLDSKDLVQRSMPNLNKIKASALFPLIEYTWIFPCLFMSVTPSVDVEVPNYIDRFAMFDASELVLEFAKGASYIFREIPFNEEPLREQVARHAQAPRRPQTIHQDNLVMRYDGIDWFGCIIEASPVLHSPTSSTTAYEILESIVVKTNQAYLFGKT
ncbi:uncharacterized protein EV420DRAFT_971984 [Desarmillaria tabescens]|uniref:Uncharacterized protein n=1 Tax=Armillaria tabescens TaxID=1929756 RepID=A0AA39JRM4_ARMTA|nr:uncharacterized protein EV420DRAFT_971984 [Desarmillaria tabescens]KAK0445318.1 hypothetical protein EV420DRAFT_971984 [Desarmillaria tabescens]